MMMGPLKISIVVSSCPAQHGHGKVEIIRELISQDCRVARGTTHVKVLRANFLRVRHLVNLVPDRLQANLGRNLKVHKTPFFVETTVSERHVGARHRRRGARGVYTPSKVRLGAAMLQGATGVADDAAPIAEVLVQGVDTHADGLRVRVEVH